MTDGTYTAILLIIDRSGSMTSIRDEVLSSVNSLVTEQAQQPGLLTVDVVTFDDRVGITHVLAHPASLHIDLEPRGRTALRDAIGIGVSTFGARLESMPEHARPGTVIAVVATDGLENATHEWSSAAVKALVDRQRDVYQWEFVFLCADQDAVTTSRQLGFARDSSIDFDSAPGSPLAAFAAASAFVTARRATGAAAFSAEDRRRASRRR